MNKKLYQKPSALFVRFENEDVLVMTSGEDDCEFKGQSKGNGCVASQTPSKGWPSNGNGKNGFWRDSEWF